jgi:hypothetical protein
MNIKISTNSFESNKNYKQILEPPNKHNKPNVCRGHHPYLTKTDKACRGRD